MKKLLTYIVALMVATLGYAEWQMPAKQVSVVTQGWDYIILNPTNLHVQAALDALDDRWAALGVWTNGVSVWTNEVNSFTNWATSYLNGLNTSAWNQATQDIAAVRAVTNNNVTTNDIRPINLSNVNNSFYAKWITLGGEARSNWGTYAGCMVQLGSTISVASTSNQNSRTVDFGQVQYNRDPDGWGWDAGNFWYRPSIPGWYRCNWTVGARVAAVYKYVGDKYWRTAIATNGVWAGDGSSCAFDMDAAKTNYPEYAVSTGARIVHFNGTDDDLRVYIGFTNTWDCTLDIVGSLGSSPTHFSATLELAD